MENQHDDPTKLVKIEWTRRKFSKFQRVFAEAYRNSGFNKEATFEFEGHAFLIGYAAYLIEFLRTQFKDK